MKTKLESFMLVSGGPGMGWKSVLVVFGAVLLINGACDAGDQSPRESDMAEINNSSGTNGGDASQATINSSGCGESPCFQSAFHQALRGEMNLSGLTTIRLFVPLGKAGSRLRVTLRSGSGELEVARAFVARLAGDGQSAVEAMPLTFGGEAGARLGPRSSVRSDAAQMEVGFRETVVLSIVARGSAAAGNIRLFPDNQAIAGDLAEAAWLSGAQALERAVMVSDVSVEGPAGRAFIAIGDSITEGYVEGSDNYVESWPAVAESLLGLPVVNAGVSGQGLDGALAYLSAEVLAAEGVTDCLVLIGTNDLGGTSVGQIEANYDLLIDRLAPFCRVHLGVLPPKELAGIQADRAALNDWIRAHPKASGVIDFASVLADPDDPTRFADGLGMDGVHPTVEGQRRMAELAAERLR